MTTINSAEACMISERVIRENFSLKDKILWCFFCVLWVRRSTDTFTKLKNIAHLTREYFFSEIISSLALTYFSLYPKNTFAILNNDAIILNVCNCFLYKTHFCLLDLNRDDFWNESELWSREQLDRLLLNEFLMITKLT